MKLNFTNLWLKTGYSFLKSIIKIDDLILYAKENEITTLAITEENVMFSAIEFYNKAIKNNIKPIIGMEVKNDEHNYIAYAKNNLGYENLMKLSSIINGVEIEKKDIYSNLIIIDIKENFDESILDKNSYYKNSKLNLAEVRYFNKDDKEAYEIFSQISGKEIDNSDYEIKSSLDYAEITLTTIEKIINKIDLKLETKVPFSLKFKTPNNISSKVFLKDICFQYLKELFKSSLVESDYVKRLERELDVISLMGFSDYFLIVWDYVKFARGQKISISPARGSVGGSLVAYLLKIIKIDPIKNNLLFERFLNSERISMPDIDLDFEDERRHEVIEYIFKTYENNNVAQIITFQTIRGRSSIRDISRVLKINLDMVDKIAKLIPFNFSLQQTYDSIDKFKLLINSNNEIKKAFDIALKIEGLPRQYSIHAAGVVISSKPIFNYSPLIYNKLHNQTLTQYSMNFLEDLGLIKFDILGLRNLTFIKNIIETIYEIKKYLVKPDELNLDDPSVYKLLSRGQTNGIFQLESNGMKKVLIRLSPKSFEDIVATSSLFRPGPQDNISQFIKNRDTNKYEIIDESIKDILKPTFGIIIYQEQIMEIVQKFASMSLAKADIFRRAISKKDIAILNQLRDEFNRGALANNHTQKKSDEVYNLIEKFADYGFNRSHAYGYSILSYVLAYLKTYFPLEFISCLLTSVNGNMSKISEYVNEAKELEIKVKLPSVNNSEANFIIKTNRIITSFSSIHNIGTKAVEELIDERNKYGEYKDIYDFLVRVSERKISIKTIESLIYSGALDEFNFSRKTLIYNLKKMIQYCQIIKVKKNDYYIADTSIFATPKWEILEDDNIELKKEYEMLGFYGREHPLKKIKSLIEKVEKIKIQNLNSVIESKEELNFIVQIVSIKQFKTKYGSMMAFLKGEDDTGQIDMSLSPTNFQKFNTKLKRGNIALLRASVLKRQTLLLNISDIKILKDV